MFHTRMFGRIVLTVCVMGILSLAGCTSLSDYVHNGFKVGPNYCPTPAPVANTGSTRPTFRLRTKKTSADGGRSSTIRRSIA